MLHKGELGIHPPGALGVSFFMHAQAECLIGRTGDGITQTLKDAGSFNLLDTGRLRSVSLKGKIFANLLEAEALDRLPELLLVCCNPDQLGLLTGELTRFLENLAERGKLKSIEDIKNRVPILLVLPNGILSELMLQTYEDQLNESRMMRRLPNVNDAMHAALIDRVVRGVSLQAGGRRGGGKDTVYLFEGKGSLVFAGGGEAERDRIEAILGSHNYPFKHARGVSGMRIEFDKAMISTVLNVGGIIHMVKDDGDLIDLRMGDLCKDPDKAEFVALVTRAVFDVGKAVGAYPNEAKYEDLWGAHRATILSFAGHVTSSVKMFRDMLAHNMKSIKLFSNEEWILTPLVRYAANAGLKDEEALFKSLKLDVQRAMARAIRYRDETSTGQQNGAAPMKLASQRNISIELFESDSDKLVAVGTMLDNEHLIKLDVTIYLPDEQITRSKLNMIRVPFPVCHEVESVAERLVGLRIERGVLAEIVRRVGGRVGCSHIKELATNIVDFAASYLAKRRIGVDPVSSEFNQKPAEERFALTKELLSDSCLAYCQTTAQGLDTSMGIKRVGKEHASPLPLGDYDVSLGVLLKDRAARWGDKVYFRWRHADEALSLTWNEFSSQVFAVARHLIDRGIMPGDRIAMLSENRVEMFMFEMAAMSIGAVSVPIFAGYLQRQIAYVLGHAKPKWLVVSGMHQLQKIERDRHPSIEAYFCMDGNAESEAWGASSFSLLTVDGGATEDELDRRIMAVQPDDLCMIMYTSGTTGPPKGVKLRHQNLISQQKAISLLWDVGENDVLMSYLPWHHSFGGLFERFMTLYSGLEFCLDDSTGRDMDRLVANWKVFNPSLFFSVPRVHDMVVTKCRENPDVEAVVFGDRLRSVFTAGASLPATVAAAYRERNIPVLEGWGLTETSPCVTLMAQDSGWKSGFVGFPIAGVTIRIEEDREILVKGPNVMSGYLDDEEATSRVIDVDGWFHTGDLGEFTADGLRILGRKDGAFKLTTGEKVHPQRVEAVLVNGSTYINQALAVGSGEDFVAVLIHPDLSRLREWADQQGIDKSDLCNQPAILELFAEELERLNPGIEVKYQRVKRAILADREPTLANGELTPSGKIVRNAVMNHNKDNIVKLFSTREQDGVIVVTQPVFQRI